MWSTFVDYNSDLETVDFISKSLDKEVYELLIKGSPLDKSKLVQVERMVTRNGKQYKKLMWILPAKVTEHHTVTGNHHLLDKNHVHYKPEGEDTKPREVKRKSKKKDVDKSKQSTTKKESTKSKLKQAAKKDNGMANLFEQADESSSTPTTKTPKKSTPKKKKTGLGTSLSQLQEQFDNSNLKQQTKEYLDKLISTPYKKDSPDTTDEKPAQKDTPHETADTNSSDNPKESPKSQSGDKDNMDNGSPSSLKEEVKENLNNIASTEKKKLTSSRTKVTYKAPLFEWKKGDPLPKHIKDDASILHSWSDVRIAYDDKSEVYATGRDRQGRKVILYSEGHIKLASENKYEFLKEWNTPEGRQKVHDAIWNMTKTKAYKNANNRVKKEIEELSTCLKLMFSTGIRVDARGDKDGTKDSGIGVTSLRGEHVIKGGKSGKDYFLRFVGKNGVPQDIKIEDADLREALRKAKGKSDSVSAHTGGKLFDVKYKKIHQAMEDIGLLPKDLRTLHANKHAQDFMATAPQPPKDLREFIKVRLDCADYVSSRLGNEPDEALASYIDPQIFQDYSTDIFNEWKAKNLAKQEKIKYKSAKQNMKEYQQKLEQ